MYKGCETFCKLMCLFCQIFIFSVETIYKPVYIYRLIILNRMNNIKLPQLKHKIYWHFLAFFDIGPKGGRGVDDTLPLLGTHANV